MARVLITGATGFLGGAAARHLRSSGWEVVASGRDPAALERLKQSGFETLPLDLSAGLHGALPAPVHAVIHCAALSSPYGRKAAFEQANVAGTQCALALADALWAQRFVNISSPSVGFALRDQKGLRESDPLPRPFNAYADTKAQAEALVHARPDLNPITLRPRGIYGAGETTLLPRLMAAAQRGPLPLFRGGRAAIDLTHVSDVVRAIEAALTQKTDPFDPVFHISGGEVLPIRQIVETACAQLNQPVQWRAMPFRPALALARTAEAIALMRGGTEPKVTAYALALFAFRQSLDLTKARETLGWTPRVPFAEGLARTITKDAA